MNRFKQFSEYLRRAIPLKRRVAIRLVDMRDEGSTSMSDRRLITISIRKSDTVSAQITTLIHEWGHAWEYDKIGNHGKGWGIGHSKAYEAWETFRDEVEPTL